MIGGAAVETGVLGLQEFSDTATGAEALDAAVKVAPVTILAVRVINPAKLVFIETGDVASVEMSLAAGRRVAGERLVGELFLPFVEQGVVAAVSGSPVRPQWDAMGVIETATIAAGIAAADIALKRAEVSLVELRFDDAMGGRASVKLMGPVGELEIGMEAAVSAAAARQALVRSVIIANPHEEVKRVLNPVKDGRS